MRLSVFSAGDSLAYHFSLLHSSLFKYWEKEQRGWQYAASEGARMAFGALRPAMLVRMKDSNTLTNASPVSQDITQPNTEPTQGPKISKGAW